VLPVSFFSALRGNPTGWPIDGVFRYILQLENNDCRVRESLEEEELMTSE